MHKDTSYPGQHDAIVSNELWGRVQQQLDRNRVEREIGSGSRAPSLLAELVFDESGKGMTPTHANKKGTRYRYYVSQLLTTTARNDSPRRRRVPARDLERIVTHRLRQFLDSEADLYAALESQGGNADGCMRRIRTAKELVRKWDRLEPKSQRAWLLRLIRQVDLEPESLEITIDQDRLAECLGANDVASCAMCCRRRQDANRIGQMTTDHWC